MMIAQRRTLLAGKALKGMTSKIAFERSFKRPSSKKSVRFSNTCAVVTLRSTDNETNSMWYANQEYRVIRHRCKQDVVAFALARKAGVKANFDQAQHCLRGLENYFPPTRQKCETTKKMRVQAVLSQQHRQRSGGFMDPESIALLSGMLSKGDRERAIEAARKDAMVWFTA